MDSVFTISARKAPGLVMFGLLAIEPSTLVMTLLLKANTPLLMKFYELILLP